MEPHILNFSKVTGADPEELYQAGNGWTLALMKNEKEVRDMKPHFSLMKNSVFGDLIVTAESMILHSIFVSVVLLLQ